MRAATAEELADHDRDLRRHEPRPTDPLPLHAQSAPIAGALEVAVLVQAVPLEVGAVLIEQYAQTMAAGARLEGVEQAWNRVDSILAKREVAR